MSLKDQLAKVTVKVSKHSPEILIGVGIISGIGATVLACKATLKVDDILDEAKTKLEDVKEVLENKSTIKTNDKEVSVVYSQKDAARDKTLIYFQTSGKLFKLYSPALGLGMLSITSILAAYNVLNKRNMALVAAYNLIEKSYSEYRKRVVEQFGEEVDRQLRHNITNKKIAVEDDKKEKVEVVEDPNEFSDYARFFDESNVHWQDEMLQNLTFLKAQQQFANDMLHSRGHLFLNEVYDMIGIPRCPAGAVVGWINDGNGDGFVDFGIYDKLYRPKRDFVNGYEKTILLDFNVDGLIWNKIS